LLIQATQKPTVSQNLTLYGLSKNNDKAEQSGGFLPELIQAAGYRPAGKYIEGRKHHEQHVIL
jgi:hypothetical protein